MRNYTTQMDAARKGIVTPELKSVAEKEHMHVEELQMCIRDRFSPFDCWMHQRGGNDLKKRTVIRKAMGVTLSLAMLLSLGAGSVSTVSYTHLVLFGNLQCFPGQICACALNSRA